jgi:hypothetical protein
LQKRSHFDSTFGSNTPDVLRGSVVAENRFLQSLSVIGVGHQAVIGRGPNYLVHKYIGFVSQLDERLGGPRVAGKNDRTIGR